jgi:hypothetical protein
MLFSRQGALSAEGSTVICSKLAMPEKAIKMEYSRIFHNYNLLIYILVIPVKLRQFTG